MKIHIHRLIAGISFFSTYLVSPLNADNSDDPFSDTSEVIREDPNEPDHLTPAGIAVADWELQYDKKLRTELKLNKVYFARMLVKPSFSGEYCVMIHGGNAERDVHTTKELFCTYSVATKSIWYSLPDNNDEKVQRPVKVNTVTVAIPKLIAMRIISLWDRMLVRTAESKSGWGGLDGTTTIYSTWMRHGEIWSPRSRKSPLLLSEVGQGIIAYCKSPPKQRPLALKKIQENVRILEEYLDKHPQ